MTSSPSTVTTSRTSPSTASRAGTSRRRSCGRSAGTCPSLAAPHIRTAAEILIDTGRRPEDVVALPLDCLSCDAGGSPVLVYDNLKASRLGRRLPIPAATARSIREQQQRVRAQFPRHPGQRAEAAAHRMGEP